MVARNHVLVKFGSGEIARDVLPLDGGGLGAEQVMPIALRASTGASKQSNLSRRVMSVRWLKGGHHRLCVELPLQSLGEAAVPVATYSRPISQECVSSAGE
jgi:hypothetical protein